MKEVTHQARELYPPAGATPPCYTPGFEKKAGGTLQQAGRTAAAHRLAASAHDRAQVFALQHATWFHDHGVYPQHIESTRRVYSQLPPLWGWPSLLLFLLAVVKIRAGV
jgi:hypothetical protein